MFKISRENKDNTETKLIQAKSIATVLLNNSNYKCEGLDEPMINESDTSNLAWILIDLIDDSLCQLTHCDLLKEEK